MKPEAQKPWGAFPFPISPVPSEAAPVSLGSSLPFAAALCGRSSCFPPPALQILLQVGLGFRKPSPGILRQPS